MSPSPEQREHAVERASRIFAVIRDAADQIISKVVPLSSAGMGA